MKNQKEMVNNPSHYGGKDNPYEAIKVIEAWDLGFNLGNTVKYISRAGKKDALVQELEKARWYLDREIANVKASNAAKEALAKAESHQEYFDRKTVEYANLHSEDMK